MPNQDSNQKKEDNLLGLDLDSILGDVLSDSTSISAAFNTKDDNAMLRVDGDKIILEIDEELEQSIDEEAKMFEVEKNYREKEYFKALTVALALNIRFKQGIGRRSDAIVRRQDEILFECNYRIAVDHLEKLKTSKGDEQLEHKLSAIMHLYTALDQQVLAGQEKPRQDARIAIDKMVERERAGGSAYVKSGFLSLKKVPVPPPEDKTAKAIYWKERAEKEADLVKKEYYLLMSFASDINYYPYQVALANLYIETNRLDEACRYIKVPLPLVEADGVDFLLKLRKKDPMYAEKFIERRFTSDIAQLRNRFEKPEPRELAEKEEPKRIGMAKQRFRKFLETIKMWQDRMDVMKSEISFRKSNLRLEYTNAFVELLGDVQKVKPDSIVQDFIERYKSTELRSVQNPHILSFIDFSFRYSVTPDEKSITGLSVEGDAETKLDALSKAIVDYFNVEIGISSKPLADMKMNVNRSTEELTKAMKASGYKFKAIPMLTKN